MKKLALLFQYLHFDSVVQTEMSSPQTEMSKTQTEMSDQQTEMSSLKTEMSTNKRTYNKTNGNRPFKITEQGNILGVNPKTMPCSLEQRKQTI